MNAASKFVKKYEYVETYYIKCFYNKFTIYVHHIKCINCMPFGLNEPSSGFVAKGWPCQNVYVERINTVKLVYSEHAYNEFMLITNLFAIPGQRPI